MVFIYILRLNRGKYYVGKTYCPQKRLQDHFSNRGSVWTKKFKPIEPVEIIPDCDHFDEDKYTKKYMDKYGINNVRGGTFSSVKLQKEEIKFLEKSILSSKDHCFVCSKKGHFANNCPDRESKEYGKTPEGVKFF